MKALLGTFARDITRRAGSRMPMGRDDHLPRSDLGRRLHDRRMALGMSLDEVAESAKMDTGYLVYLEEHPAVPSMDTLLALAHALETTVPELLGWEPTNADATL